MNLLGYAQRLGKSLMLPIATLPVAALLLRLGAPDLFNLPWMFQAGSAIFSNLSLIFALGIAVGLARDEHGAAALAGVIGWFVLTNTATTVNDTINMGVFSGIIAGIVAGHAYNRFHAVKLPDYLAFFGGKRLVPIMTGLITLLLGFVLGYLWPVAQQGIDAFGNGVIESGSIGQFIYGTFNRLLIPVGLHHVLNNIFWFGMGECVQVTYAVADAVRNTCLASDIVSNLSLGDYLPGIDNAVVTAISTTATSGDLLRFAAGDPTAGVFMAGFYPVMMFGLPGAALAMYFAAPKERRAEVGGILFSAAFTAFLTGVTEPIEFLFVFLAPALYVLHAVLTGISLVVANISGALHGFGFSAGLFDLVLNWSGATRPVLLVIQGVVWFALYFVLFSLAIRFFRLKTPGNESIDAGTGTESGLNVSGSTPSGVSGQSQQTLARQYLKALGGHDNISHIDACITRLRLSVKDRSRVQESAFKKLGAKGVVSLGEKNLQIILGPQAEIIAAELRIIPTDESLQQIQLPV
ncbi:N-acetylglucosamine-specific PTS transporter subunit IIBC [Nitrincola alkalilacustris]|uniref:N-acetylglucosamine-specific PTS transporter subunit IIBC n=1 Tax=Nitrincola alkalilacustris TaxID=1571224 RepID=UPI00124F1023|nr:N-acetylglucosamine-specific PTS transporter subunit IIBC [Nitrincola alkalilacustris]